MKSTSARLQRNNQRPSSDDDTLRMTNMSLIERMKAPQDEVAWREFASIYEQLIFNWLKAQGIQPNDADDIKQEVMTVVIEHLDSFEHSGQPGSFRSWLRQITGHRLLQMWDKKTREQRHFARVNLSEIGEDLRDDNSSTSQSWDDNHDRQLIAELLNRAASQFSSKHVQAFQRVFVLGQPAASVAADLGMTLGAVRVAQHRIVKMLRTQARDLID